jgi:hypothetical protein
MGNVDNNIDVNTSNRTIRSLRRQIDSLQNSMSSLATHNMELSTQVEHLSANVQKYQILNAKKDIKINELKGEKKALESLEDPVLFAAAVKTVVHTFTTELRKTKTAQQQLAHPFADHKILRSYRHSSFIEGLEDTCPRLIDFLRTLVTEAKKAGTTALTESSIASFTESKQSEEGKSSELADEAAPDESTKLDRWLATAMACFLTYISADWKWPWAWIVIIQFQAIAHSAFITDMLSGIIPGCPTSSSVYSKTREFVKSVLSVPAIVTAGAVALIRYDNISFNYRPSPTRGGLDNPAETKVATAMDMLYRGCKVSDLHNSIQTDYKNGPIDDTRYDVYMNDPYTNKTPYIPSVVACDVDGEAYSEMELFERERKGYLLSRLTHILTNRSAVAAGDPAFVSVPTPGPPDPPALIKTCPICFNCFPSSKRKCFYCKTPLPTAAATKTAMDAESLKLVFAAPTKRRKGIQKYVAAYTFDSEVITMTKVLVETDDFEDSENCSEYVTPNPGVEDDGAYMQSFVLPTITVNPSSVSAVKLILTEICKLAKVRGSKGEDDKPIKNPDREWVYVCCDAGAMHTSLLDVVDSTEPDSPLRNIRYVVGIGHETMCFTKFKNI